MTGLLMEASIFLGLISIALAIVLFSLIVGCTPKRGRGLGLHFWCLPVHS